MRADGSSSVDARNTARLLQNQGWAVWTGATGVGVLAPGWSCRCADRTVKGEQQRKSGYGSGGRETEQAETQ